MVLKTKQGLIEKSEIPKSNIANLEPVGSKKKCPTDLAQMKLMAYAFKKSIKISHGFSGFGLSILDSRFWVI